MYQDDEEEIQIIISQILKEAKRTNMFRIEGCRTHCRLCLYK